MLLLPCGKGDKGQGCTSLSLHLPLHGYSMQRPSGCCWTHCKPGLAGGDSCSSGFLQFMPSCEA